MSEVTWHLLQVSDVLDLELASALAESVSLIAWEPERRWLTATIKAGSEIERRYPAGESSFRIRALPLMRGFARAPMRWVAGTGPEVLARLLAQTPDPERSPLVCSTPYFADVAEQWPGPVVYWLTDLIAEYSSANRRAVHRLDRRMCQAATLVCPNSARLSEYLVEVAGCEVSKLKVVPNATRAMNLLASAPLEPASLPAAVQGRARPVAGVIGNLAGNMDWLLLEEMVRRTPWLTWVFVGPVSMHVADATARRAREMVQQMGNAVFVGRQPYGMLAEYARSFDVAVLPYRRCEPTYSGSSTRFYEHLAACRPMLSTRGLAELLHKTPLLSLFDTADEGVAGLETLRRKGFDDGLADLRWRSSQDATWTVRAQTIERELAVRVRLQEFASA